MNLTKIGIFGLLLVGGTLWAIRANAETQAWQDVWPDDRQAAAVTPDATATADDNWRPVASQQQPIKRMQPTAQRWISPQRNVQPASYDEGTAELVKTPNGTLAPIPQGTTGGIIQQGEPQFEVATPEAMLSGDISTPRRGCASCGNRNAGFAADCDGDGGECGDCEPCNQCPRYELFDGCCMHLFRDLSVFGGVDGFKGPLDGGTNGNFGMNEGLNYAAPLGDPWGCGYQLGANFVQSDFSGAPNMPNGDGGSLNASFRRQVFATAGIFRRAEVGEFQLGVAFDYLNDDYYAKADFKQLRSEIGYVVSDCWEVGYFGAYSVGSTQVLDYTLDTTDMFALYVRHTFENGGNGRIWGGATSYGNGLLGADLWIPLGGGWALENRATYVIPKQGVSDTGERNESWGLVMQLVWYPGQSANCQARNVYRPLFGVADNSLMMEHIK
jgi:hypothetical protein